MVKFYWIAIAIILVDQLTKQIVVRTMELGERITIIENFFYLTSHRNPGAAWGILAGQMWFFYIITMIVIIGVIYYMQKHAKESKLLGVSLALILGGAIGNFIDRLYLKEVIDFLDFYIFTYNYPIFNIADSSLVIGVGLMIIYTFKTEVKTKE